VAISLCSDDEAKKLKAIERFIGRKLEREVIRGFEPTVKAVAHPLDEGEYGGFEADTKPQHKGQFHGRGGNSTSRKKRK
jgi:ATP-dependent RNA helicase RhlE